MVGLKKTKDQLKEIFKRVTDLLNKYKINFFVFYGTLLGIIRSNDLIDNDDDVDILVHISDQQKVKILEDGHLIEVRELKYDHQGEVHSMIQLYFKNDLGPCDIYFYEERDHLIYIRWDFGLIYDTCDIFPLISKQFLDRNILIPKNSEKILRETYGEKWKIPIKREDYDWENINGKVNIIYNPEKNNG
ncbi:MAG TPA: LicD family protein [Candidatus Deferrimicrobium sp.]|nr:LicD family protein [Candidatus Deferrimicrobium sp.]